jgi:repressor LexA
MTNGKRRRGRPPSTEPSATQQQIIEFIRGYSDRHGYPPSLTEISDGVGRAYSSVKEALERLERLGFITRQPNVARSLMLTEKAGGKIAKRDRRRADRSLYVPLVGRAPAGEPLLSEENVEEEMLIPYWLLRRHEDGFLVRIQGDSMAPRLEDGDVVVVHPQPQAETGQIVVARVGDDDAATDVCVKVLRRQNGKITLTSLNPAYGDVDAEFVEVLGVVVGMMRAMR